MTYSGQSPESGYKWSTPTQYNLLPYGMLKSVMRSSRKHIVSTTWEKRQVRSTSEYCLSLSLKLCY